MEMVEEEENQQFMEKFGEDVDRISSLPDCVLVEILSRLPSTKEAIKTGTLSKRWEHLWTWLPTLFFDDEETRQLTYNFFPGVDKTLSQCRQLKLKKFGLDFYDYYPIFESYYKNWVRYAISRNVEELNLSCVWSWGDQFVLLDQIIFTCSCFTHLKLKLCAINPCGLISWNNLRSLSISDVDLNEDVIENILSGSPLLETLELVYCFGYRELNITSKSVKNLVFSSYTHPVCLQSPSDVVEIIAPNILSLKIDGYLEMWKLLLLNVSSLVEANLTYRWKWCRGTSTEEEALKGFIQSLSHVKELQIGVPCSEVLSRLKAEGFVFPSNLKTPDGFERVEYGDDSYQE